MTLIGILAGDAADVDVLCGIDADLVEPSELLFSVTAVDDIFKELESGGVDFAASLSLSRSFSLIIALEASWATFAPTMPECILDERFLPTRGLRNGELLRLIFASGLLPLLTVFLSRTREGPGVFLGCPTGAGVSVIPAFEVDAAGNGVLGPLSLDPNGGVEVTVVVFVSCLSIFLSSSSFRIASMTPHRTQSNCFWYMYCCLFC